MPPNAPPGSRRLRPTGRVVGALVLAGLVGLRELRRSRETASAQPATAQPATVPPVATETATVLPATARPAPAKPSARARPAVARASARRTRLGFYRPRHKRRGRGRRVARVCFALSAAGAMALPVVWFNTRPASDAGELTHIRAARAAAPPTTAMPLAPGQPPLLTYPARLQDQPARLVNRPVGVHIPALGLAAPTVPVGVIPDSRLLEAPADAATLGWYEHGPAPGEAGSSVIAGHVDHNGGPGAFFGLSRLEPGADVTIDYQDGSSRAWRVVARRQYVKSELPTDLLFARTGAPTLALVTCGGLYDESKRFYRDNVVVFAVPVT